MNLLWWRDKKSSEAIPGKRVEYDALVRQVNRRAETYGKELCLDLGAGNVHESNYTSTDIDPKCNPDLVMDFRAIFAASDVYRDMRKEYPDIEKLVDDWELVRMIDVVEHVEWIYQVGLYQWLYKLITPGGMLYISTPNLEYATRLYVENLDRISRGLMPAFPRNEHSDFEQDHKLYDITKYINFKFHSGCSWGDYHHATLDKYWLVTILHECGFEDIKYCDAQSLYVMATKPKRVEAQTVTRMVEDTISAWKR